MRYLCIIVPVVLCAIILAMQLHVAGRSDRFGINAGYYFSGDGAWAGQMQPAAADKSGGTSLVPAPLTGQQNSYLRGDGQWIQASNAPTAAQYLHVANTTTDSYLSGKPIPFPTTVISATNTILLASPYTTFVLQPGQTYKLMGGVNYWSARGGVYQWYVVGGMPPGYIGTGGDGIDIASSAAIAYVAPTVITSVCLNAVQDVRLANFQGTGICAWATVDVVSNNNTILPFTGATSGANGFVGYIPAPLAGQQNHVLTGGGGWAMNNSITVQNNMTSSRSLGKVYRNTTGKSMFVSVTNGGAAALNHLQAFCDSTTTPTTLVSWNYADLNGCSVSFWVLNNYYYSVSVDIGGGVVRSWIEWY